MIYKCSWSLLNGLKLDELVSPDNHANLLESGFQSNGIIDNGYTVYYIKAVNDSREVAVDKLRQYIEEFMKRCIDEHETILKSSRNDWKKCK